MYTCLNYMYMYIYMYVYIYIVYTHVCMTCIQGCGNIEPTPGHFCHSCPAPDILCIQFSFVLLDIH